jgi:hypothetical protein
MNKRDKEYYKFYFSKLAEIENIYDDLYLEVSRVVLTSHKGGVFNFKDSGLSSKIDDIIKDSTSKAVSAIKTGMAFVWKLSNRKNDEIVSRLPVKRSAWMNHNEKNLSKLLTRKINGLTISRRVWNYNDAIKSDMEDVINAAFDSGTSAAELSRSLKKYLNNPDALFRRVRDDKGELKLSKPAMNYHPGRGVYRSASKNAMRLAGNEINHAYREADMTRWQQMDFVLGYDVVVSPRSLTVCPMCQSLAGRYPKDFRWTGWHVQCRCSAVPVLPDPDKFIENMDSGFDEITEMPERFNQWVKDNREKIATSIQRGKIPYFLRDNKKRVQSAL